MNDREFWLAIRACLQGLIVAIERRWLPDKAQERELRALELKK